MYASRRSLRRRHERVTALAAVIAVHALLGIALIAGLALHASRVEDRPLVAVNLAPDPPPPPPVRPEATLRRPAPAPARAHSEPRAAPSPVAAPRAVQSLPVAAAPAQGGRGTTGMAAGGGDGTGGGDGGGGSGGAGDGGGIGSEARLVAGGISRRDYAQIGADQAPSGQARLALTVGPGGRLTACSAANSSGDPAIDRTLCALLEQRMEWEPARDRAGRPIPVTVFYIATWRRR